MIFAFLEPDYPATAVALIDSGLSGHEAEQVLLESFPRPAVQRYLRASADATVRYLRAEGVLEDPETHESFARAGLIDASTQHPLTSRSNPPWHGMSNDENLRLPTADDLAAFDRDGFVVLRDALPGELIEPLHKAALRLRAAAPVRCSYRGNGKLGFRTLVSHDQEFLPLVANPRVLPTIAALLSPDIRMLSSHLITYDPQEPDDPMTTSTDSPRPVGGQKWHRDDVFHIQGDLGYAAVPRLTVHCAYCRVDGGSFTRRPPQIRT
ncbi:phytanoyl-CoA dioxygenase family protein [Micromonospora craniellae]|nr:hypothetical protein [Micromonospora craniellae]